MCITSGTTPDFVQFMLKNDVISTHFKDLSLRQLYYKDVSSFCKYLAVHTYIAWYPVCKIGVNVLKLCSIGVHIEVTV